MFFRETISGYHDFKQKGGHNIEPTAGVNGAKICPKIDENCKYFYLQCNN